MSKSKITSFQIAGIFIATLIGAGFASGQEILQFFVYYGLWGVIGIIVATGLFVFFGYEIMELAFELKAKSHLEVIRKAAGKWLSRFIDIVITAFLLAGFVVMCAGSGAIFAEQFQLSSWLGSVLMIIVAVATVFLGVRGIISSMNALVPLLIFSIFIVCILSLMKNPLSFSDLRYVQDSTGIVGNWFLSSLIYVSYNIVVAVAVLAPLGQLAENKVTLLKGAVLGGFGLGVTALLIQLGIFTNLPQAANYEIPMNYLAGRLSPVFYFGYIFVLLAGIYTTAVGSLFGFLTRILGIENRKVKLVSVILGAFALPASQLGFANLVKTVYPAVGYAGILLLIGLTYGKVVQSINYGLILAKPFFRRGDENE